VIFFNIILLLNFHGREEGHTYISESCDMWKNKIIIFFNGREKKKQYLVKFLPPKSKYDIS